MTYEVVIGLEVHVELATESKIFCACANNSAAAANENVCPACAGMPGLLPVTNRAVVEKAIAAGLVTNCRINRVNTFDKKNYYYPDLSNSYQITQLYAPICVDGYVEIETAKGKKKIGVKQIHMEEDAGKLLHDDLAGISMVDYNRCSVPLVEIVSKPDLRSAEEVVAYLEKLRALLRYANVGHCRMEAGLMRADINISVREKGDDKLGVRTEIKNMNSFAAIQKAIAYETERHIDAIEWDEPLVQETRGWDAVKNESFAMREKENATDYFYFPDPDLPPVIIDEAWIARVRDSLPEMPDAKQARYLADFGLKQKDAAQLIASPNLAAIFEAGVAAGAEPREAANWLLTEALACAKKAGQSADDIRLDPAKLAVLLRELKENRLTRPNAKLVFAAVFQDDADPLAYIRERRLDQVADDSAVRGLLTDIVARNPKSVADFRAGKTKAIDFLFGQAMRELKGSGDPKLIRDILTELLSAE